MGLSTVFLILGLVAAQLGHILLQYQKAINIFAGATILILGLHYLGIFKIGFLDQEARVDAKSSGGSAVGAYLLGLAFAFGWSPCLGPMLSAILGLIVTEDSLSRGVILMAGYAAGLGIPFIIAALLFDKFASASNRLKSHMPLVKKVMEFC